MKRIVFALITIICLSSCMSHDDSDSKTRVVMRFWNDSGFNNLAFESNIVPFLQELDGLTVVRNDGQFTSKKTVIIALNKVRAVPYKYYKKIDMIQNDQDAYISIYRVEEDGTKTLLKTWYSSDRNKDGVQFFDLNQWKADRLHNGLSYIPEIYFKFNLTKTDLGL